MDDRVARELAFWSWLVREGAPKFWNGWLVVHLFVGAALALGIEKKLSEVGTTALIPLAAVLVGLAFAWSGNASSLLTSDPVQRVGENSAGSTYRGWVFSYQMAVLTVISAMVTWGLLAAGVADSSWVTREVWDRMIGRTIVFAFTSMTVRECWQMTLGVQKHLLIHMLIGKATKGRGLSLEDLYKRYVDAYTAMRSDGRVVPGLNVAEATVIALGVADAVARREMRAPEEVEAEYEKLEPPTRDGEREPQ